MLRDRGDRRESENLAATAVVKREHRFFIKEQMLLGQYLVIGVEDELERSNA